MFLNLFSVFVGSIFEPIKRSSFIVGAKKIRRLPSYSVLTTFNFLSPVYFLAAALLPSSLSLPPHFTFSESSGFSFSSSSSFSYTILLLLP